MAYNGEGESRHTSYAELDGVEVKISEKYKVVNSAAFMQQMGMACLTLKDLSKLQDQFEYDYQTEHLVLQNFDMTLKRQTAAKLSPN